MARPMYNVFDAGMRGIARILARLGFIDAHRGARTVDLAWPRMVTGFARVSQQIADLAMVGSVLGAPAVAGIAFASAYWQIATQISIGLTGGSIGMVSQRFGASDGMGVDLVTKLSVLVSIALALPIVTIYWLFAPELVRLLGAGPAAASYGTVYLRVVGLAIGFEFLNKVASRVLVGVDDAVTPMYVRAGGAVANIVFNVVFIFGLGLGVFGAALGTLLATVLTTALFVVGFFGRRVPGIGSFPVHLSPTGPHFDGELARQLLVISFPLMGRRAAHSAVIFPFLAIVGVFGTGAVAAFEVGRRLRTFMNAPGWGFSLASSSLVGQQLGVGDEAEATAYSRDIIRLAVVVYLLVAGIIFVFSRPLARLFVAQPHDVGQTTAFIRIACIAVIWLGVDGAATGALRSAGDTRWPLYGKFVGLYVVALPIAYLGIITPLGLIAVYVAFISEAVIPAVVSFYRLRTGKWKVISRLYRPQPMD